MAEVMSINTEAVGAAINQISVYTADIATRNKKFLELLSEKNKATQGKFQLLKTLEEKLGTTLVISDKAQLCGALGAALFAKDMVTE